MLHFVLEPTKILFAALGFLSVCWTAGVLADQPEITPTPTPTESSGSTTGFTGTIPATETRRPTAYPTPTLAPTPEPNKTPEPTKTPVKRIVVLPSPSPDPIPATPTKKKENGEITLAPGEQREIRVRNVAGGLQFGIVSKNRGNLFAEYFAPEQLTTDGQIMEGQKHNGVLSYDKNAGLKDDQGNIILRFDLSTGQIGNVNNKAQEQQGRPWLVKIKNIGTQMEPFKFFAIDIAKGCAYFLRYEPPISMGWPICKDKSNENEWKTGQFISDLAAQAVAWGRKEEELELSGRRQSIIT